MSETSIGKVAEIWRYPVQSMRGESLAEAEIGAAGIIGDRAYGLVDPGSGGVVSSAQGRRQWRGIVTLAVRYRAAAPAQGGPAPIEIMLPDGTTLIGEQPDVDARLSAALGQPVHLADKATEGVRSTYDHSPLHLLTTATLKQLAEHHAKGEFVSARFRPNVVIDTDAQKGFIEQGWIERRLLIGEIEIAVTEDCKRCVMTTLPQGPLPMDPGILHTVTVQNRTRAGIYAAVTRPGTIKIGDAVRLLD